MMILDRFMPSCQEVTKKLAEGEFENIPWHTRLSVRIHLSMCRHCTRFARQLMMIAQTFRNIGKRKPDPADVETAKQHILTRLKQS